MSQLADDRKVAFITGGAGGIGTAIARDFASAGYAIALVDVKGDALENVLGQASFAKTKTAAIVGNISDPDTCDRAIEQALSQLGRVDVLVNNAGVGFSSPLDKLSVADIDDVLDVNARAPILLSRAVVPHMTERGSGSIVNISSISAKLGAANIAPYSASKAALIGFTRALAIELAPKGVRVNAVCPGSTNTPMMQNNIRNTMREKNISYEAALAEWERPIPTRKMMEPEDIADAVLFLASERARCITGEALNVSSGVVMW